MPTQDFGRFLLLHSRDTWPPLLLQVSLLLTMITSDFWDQQPIAEQAHVVYWNITETNGGTSTENRWVYTRSPFGQFYVNKLPFGISSTPELYQHRVSQILARLEGVLCYIDNILIFGVTPAEHGTRLTAVLTRLAVARVTLNKDKCELYWNNICFLGHLID